MRADAYTGRGHGWRKDGHGYTAVAEFLNAGLILDPQ